MRAGVVGCGVAGMTAATALARLGHEVEVLERFEAPRPVGAGLLLQPTGLAALDAMGLSARAQAWGAPISGLHGRTPKGRTVLRLAYRGRPGLGVHRAALFETLRQAMQETPARLVTGVEACAVEDLKTRPVVRDAGGGRHGPYDVLVVADGSGSALREAVIPKARAPRYPWGAFWTIRPDPERAWTDCLRQVYEGCAVMIGALPVGRAPGSDVANNVAVFWSLKTDALEAARADGARALQDAIARRWPAAAELLDGVDTMQSIASASYRDVRAWPWTRGRAVLIGDAAHGMSPQLGQGANLAIIDALTLANAIGPAAEGGDVEAALEAHARARGGHARYYQFMSRALTPVFQSDSRAIGWLRDAALGPLSALPLTRDLMRATLTGRARWGLSAWRGAWEPAP